MHARILIFKDIKGGDGENKHKKQKCLARRVFWNQELF